MKLIGVIVLVFTAGSLASAKDSYVKGYVKQDGTYVQPHYRSGADSTTSNNYSTKGNYNPYTGKAGTKNSDTGTSSSFGSDSND